MREVAGGSGPKALKQTPHGESDSFTFWPCSITLAKKARRGCLGVMSQTTYLGLPQGHKCAQMLWLS